MDLTLTVLWLGILSAGIAAIAVARSRGLSAPHARDLLHVGTGVWVLGWPWWEGLVAPLAIVTGAAAVVALVPVAARRIPAVARLRRGAATGEETFAGLVVYTLAFAVLTALGLTGDPFPAAAALWALALGDGLGGLVGRRYGRLSYATRFGKRKTVEGSLAVTAFATAGVAAASAWFGVGIPAWQIAALGVTAAAAEGLAPRASDNALVPGAVWMVARLIT